MDRPRVVVIIPAGGTGRRMGGELPKQYLPLGEKPLLWHTLERFERSAWVDGIVLVVRPEDAEICRSKVLEDGRFVKVRELVPGGGERWESVLFGLQRTAPEDEIVLVHDAVRPFVSEDLLKRVVEAAVECGAAIPALPVKETVKVVAEGYIVRTPDRAELRSAQTPQGFRRDLLLDAYGGMVDGESVTDDAMLVESMGQSVRVVEGDGDNLKITTPGDLAWASWFTEREGGAEMGGKKGRVGLGFDVHRLAAERRLILGGIDIPYERGLAGHSDADVLTHAIIDALLGAIGAGDIGRLFPDTDVQFKDISSLVLLSQVRDLLAEKGAYIGNIDAVIMAQRPKLAPYVEPMTIALSETLGIHPEAISLKATTTEKLGFVGREEGIAAQAVAWIEV
jgi:2-C-methyl-D-erythritol 4-phosphate cytidylyltransferase / 2-C-methyl-D-erythritol 2,4-cyclodiphosphate synthase